MVNNMGKYLQMFVLVNMNDYLVTNNLLEDIVKPLLGEEKTCGIK